MKALRVGQQAVLVECTDAREVAATYAWLRRAWEAEGAAEGAAPVAAPVEIVPAARTVLLDGVREVEATLSWLEGAPVLPVGSVQAEASPRASGPVIDLPTHYDGPDLEEVARQWQCSIEDVVRRHQAQEFVVDFCGFSPGFAYCSSRSDLPETARRAVPRTRVPAGSVALGGTYTAVYPRSSPGGWQLIGTTATELWRPELDPPALLAPGTRVRFVDG